MALMEKLKIVFPCCQCEKTLTECNKYLCESDDDGDDDSREASPRGAVGRSSTEQRPFSEEELQRTQAAERKEMMIQRASQMAADLKAGVPISCLESNRTLKGMMALSPTKTTLIFTFSKFRNEGPTKKDFTISFKTLESVFTFYDKSSSDWPDFIGGISVESRERLLAMVDSAPPFFFTVESTRIRDSLIYFLNSKTQLNLPDPQTYGQENNA